MYEHHLKFLDWAGRYDTGDANMRSRARHDLWQEGLACPLLTVDGTWELDSLVRQAIRTAEKIQPDCQ